MPMSALDVTVELRIPDNRIADLICCGMEGGVGYWGKIIEYIEPNADNLWKGYGWDDHVYPHIHYPMSNGGAVIFRDAEEDPDNESADTWRFDREAIERGMKLFAGDPNYSYHFANFINENEDAETGDVFIQLCCMGAVIFS